MPRRSWGGAAPRGDGEQTGGPALSLDTRAWDLRLARWRSDAVPAASHSGSRVRGRRSSRLTSHQNLSSRRVSEIYRRIRSNSSSADLRTVSLLVQTPGWRYLLPSTLLSARPFCTTWI